MKEYKYSIGFSYSKSHICYIDLACEPSIEFPKKETAEKMKSMNIKPIWHHAYIIFTIKDTIKDIIDKYEFENFINWIQRQYDPRGDNFYEPYISNKLRHLILCKFDETNLCLCKWDLFNCLETQFDVIDGVKATLAAWKISYGYATLTEKPQRKMHMRSYDNEDGFRDVDASWYF